MIKTSSSSGLSVSPNDVAAPSPAVRPDPTPGNSPPADRVLTQEMKHYFDAVIAMRDASWNSFERRRAFEWKLSFGLWTALGAIIGALATGRARVSSPGEAIALSGLSVLVVLIHIWWSAGLFRVNSADLRKTYAYEDELLHTLRLTDRTSTGREIGAVKNTMNNRRALDKVWGHATQVALTTLLALGVGALTWLH